MCCRCCCLVPRLSTQAFCDFVHLAANHLLNVSTGRNFVCSRREHGLNGGLDFGDGGRRLEVDARQFFVVLVEGLNNNNDNTLLCTKQKSKDNRSTSQFNSHKLLDTASG
jgi:hypothetical protein